jgi:hypothetical protein
LVAESVFSSSNMRTAVVLKRRWETKESLLEVRKRPGEAAERGFVC